MVNNSNYRIGIDKIESNFLAARVELCESSRKILSLKKLSQTDLLDYLNAENRNYAMSVPDNAVIYKILESRPDSANFESRSKFELAHSLLDNPADFCYDIVSTGLGSRQLAVLVRHSKLKELLDSSKLNALSIADAPAFLARSIALGRGFLEYCSNDTERLLCLADFSDRLVSLCFVLGDRIIAPASFDQSRFEQDTEAGHQKITAELKTIINFKLNELAQRGLKISLSKLIVCGGKLTYNQKQTIAAKLVVQLEAPRFKDSMLNDVQIPTDSTWADYLVTLGLTTE